MTSEARRWYFRWARPRKTPSFKLWSRILTREARRAAAAPVGYPDPRGDPEVRKEVAAGSCDTRPTDAARDDHVAPARVNRHSSPSCNPEAVYTSTGAEQ